MEIEAKYRVVGKLSPQRITLVDLHAYVVKPAEDERHHDSLLEATDRVIASNGYSLGVPEAGKRRILTLKGPPQGEGELHRREEIEADLDADSPGATKKGRVSRARWPEPIKSRVTEMIGAEQLLALVHTDIHRTTWK